MSFKLFFSDYFEIDAKVLDDYGALNICVDADLPLFVDPFLLFASKKAEYIHWHKKIVDHLIHLKHIAVNEPESDLRLFQFPEVKQNWLGMCKWGNNGKGLGPRFARDLIKSFNGFYSDFGEETVSSSSHIEKLTLVGSGVGRDFISDFSTNLMLEYLLNYSQEFAIKFLREDQKREFSVRCYFDRKAMIWMPKTFILPFFYLDDGDFMLLTPLDILTKDEAFISPGDLKSQFHKITSSLENPSLRSAINDYFRSCLPKRGVKKSDEDQAFHSTIQKYPIILDYYIKHKEEGKDDASRISSEKVENLRNELIGPIIRFCEALTEHSDFFRIQPRTYEAALQRVHFLKNVIENNDGYRIFYKDGKPIASEETIQRIFRLTWFATDYDVNSEVNNGRGPADYKISYGDRDSTIVEFKLASSSSLKKNLQNQCEIYKTASNSINDIKVILCYSDRDVAKVKRVLKELHQETSENVIVIDGQRKISASKV
jgi:hypothetical protein